MPVDHAGFPWDVTAVLMTFSKASAYLLSYAASSITSETMSVDGGNKKTFGKQQGGW